MSGNIDHPSDKDDKGRKRDLSPSAYSQSSALEWDPSADVGTSARHEDVEPHDQSAASSPGTHGVDRNVAGPSTGRPRISRSRSYEYPMEEHPDDHHGLQHKTSLGELANRPLSLVQDWVTKRYLHPEDDGGASFLETMVSGFTARRQVIEAVQPESKNPPLIVSTILPPPRPHSRSNSHKSVASENSGLPKDLKLLDVEMDSGSVNQLPRTYSNGFAPHLRHEVTPRSHSMDDGLYDSTTAPTASSGSGFSKYTLSDFSAEMSRIKANRKDSSGATNERSGISEWLEVGMTKSEKEYKKQKEKLDSGRSSSMLFVEIQHNFDKKSAPEGHKDVECRNIGVQTSTLQNDSSADVRDSTSHYSSIYHSTPTDRPRQAHQSTKYGNNGENIQHGGKKERRRERSPPQPFAAATRKSSHRHHYAHHNRNDDTEISSFIETNKPEVLQTPTSSSDLSPPCFLIDKLVKTHKSPIKKDDIVSAIEIHRDYHVKKVRHELRQLEKLNQLLSKNLNAKHRQYSSSETEGRKPPETRLNQNSSKPPKSRSPQKPAPKSYKKDTSISTSSDTRKNSSNIPKDLPSKPSLSGSGIDNLLKDIKQISAQQKDSPLEKKMDELMDAFSFISGMILEMDKGKDTTSSKERKDTKKSTSPKLKPKTPCAPVKPPVAYFIPYPNCQGQYVFRKEDIECFNRKQGKQVVNTASRTVSRQGVKAIGNDDNDSWEDDDEDAENRDPAIKENLHGCTTKFNLQAAFERRCPNFVSRLRQREAVLARIKSEREIRAEKKREWIRMYGNSPRDLEELDAMLPTKGPRLMTTKEMREITQRHYKNLPEVQEKYIQRKVEEEKKTNRIMSQVFAQQLQKGVLKGELNLIHSRSLLRR